MVEQEALVRALMMPQTYPHHPATVEMVQTQMSFIFLTGDYVYKVKKPVDLGYLDYTTLEKRRHMCQQELVLNRRLCPDIYLDVVPITEKSGTLSIGGEGAVVEYAVRMRQLPRDRTMDQLLKAKQMSRQMVEQVARILARFHYNADTNEAIAAYGDINMIAINAEENFSQTQKYKGSTIPPEQYETISHYTRGFIKSKTTLFLKRMNGGRIRDCHGDLHAAHVCFTDGICIFDCIEFNDRFRYCDVASEVAFLAMDLDCHGRPDLSQQFVEAYITASGDAEIPALLNFYKCYRAYVRGKVESFKLDDPFIPAEEKNKARAAAQNYFSQAASYMNQ